jgi:integrase
MNLKRSVQFRPEQRKKNGVAVTENMLIRMRVTFNCSRIDFSTGYRIDLSKWDNGQQRVKKGFSNKQKQTYTEINSALVKYESIIQEIFKEYEMSDCMPTVEQIKQDFVLRTQLLSSFNEDKNKAQSKKTSDNEGLLIDVKPFFEVYDEYVQTQGLRNNWSQTCYHKFRALRNKLKEFNSKLTFECFDENGLSLFVGFLINQKMTRNSTVCKTLVFLKMFLRWSYNNGYHNNNGFSTFKPKLKVPQRKVIFLTPEELKRIIDLEIPEEKCYLERVRDVFIFMCFTGLRHSDTFNLRRSDIKGDHIEIVTIKTDDDLIIELNQYSKAVLDKYKDIPYPDDKALPVISNQKMNVYLKELTQLAEINEPVRMIHYKGSKRIEKVSPKHELICTHAARRTFVCSALSLGIPAQVVMKWTGHSDYKAMKPYMDIADDIRAKSMKKFNQMDNLL